MQQAYTGILGTKTVRSEHLEENMPARTARTYKIEKQSLEAHVDICAERYDRLEIRMDNLSEKVESNSEAITREATSTRKMMMASTGTIIAALISLVAALVYMIK